MAEAYGQLTGRPAVCLGTRAVGASNLAIGIHTARQDSTPMFALVGQVQRAFLGREAFQEVDQVATLGGLAKWAAQPMTAGRDPRGHGRSRPPGARWPTRDRSCWPCPRTCSTRSRRTPARRPQPRAGAARATEAEIRSVLNLLAGAERPVILAGAGVLRARTSTELVKFAELLHVPVMASWRHGDVISNDNPLYLGMAGLGCAGRRPRAAGGGRRGPGARFTPERGHVVRVHAARRRRHAGSTWTSSPGGRAGLPPAERVITSDARTFLKAANEILISRGVLDAGLVASAAMPTTPSDRAAWEAATVVDAIPWDGPGIHPGRVVATLRSVLPDDAILTTDAGNFAGWAGRGFRFRRPGTFLGPTSGAMGYGLPAAIAAALVQRDRPSWRSPATAAWR